MAMSKLPKKYSAVLDLLVQTHNMIEMSKDLVEHKNNLYWNREESVKHKMKIEESGKKRVETHMIGMTHPMRRLYESEKKDYGREIKEAKGELRDVRSDEGDAAKATTELQVFAKVLNAAHKDDAPESHAKLLARHAEVFAEKIKPIDHRMAEQYRGLARKWKALA